MKPAKKLLEATSHLCYLLFIDFADAKIYEFISENASFVGDIEWEDVCLIDCRDQIPLLPISLR